MVGLADRILHDLVDPLIHIIVVPVTLWSARWIIMHIAVAGCNDGPAAATVGYAASTVGMVYVGRSKQQSGLAV